MQIDGPGHIHGPQIIRAPHRVQQSAQPEVGLELQADEVDISPQADFVSRAQDLPDVRTELVADIRAQIELGSYETDDRLAGAVGKLLDEIG